ncbi:imelysin family protein [Colwellia hornerae]|uniref:Imelysin family protein n=1 Tax=Colwellia hornerae TaxID=89402 RepID=A0A5C6Q8N5_9GAMM|nr:imelysin family protein [Colwellia hornerae]TWX50224.1 imelysin family protein [Colwellia hornerae]TWX56121.1 imelysin family protein [Colwellia hornerae]TWX65143.1 imelysin family protein [Colwellia hornerae]
MSVNINHTALSIAIVAGLLVSACGESTSSSSGESFGTSLATTPNPAPNPSSNFNQQALLENITDNIITPVFEQFATVSATQIPEIAAYCKMEKDIVLGNATTEQVNATRDNARTAWRNTMNVWQQAEVMKVGPLTDNEGLLRDKIYSWPVVNSCSVDFEVVNFKAGVVNGQPFNIAQRTPSRRGLAAIEYLLFNEQLNHSCMTSTQPENWDNQTDGYRKIARCEFALEAARDVNNSAKELITAWSGNNGYASTLKAAGSIGSQFSTELEAINLISDGLFYLDTFTKDGKLATPLGLQANSCGSQACPDVVESVYAHHSVTNIENNLLAFQKLLTGKTGTGFTHYLIDVGDPDTADSMSTDVQLAIDGVQSYQNSLADALVNNEAQVTQTHADVKQVTDRLKIDFITSLSLKLPATSAGDND